MKGAHTHTHTHIDLDQTIQFLTEFKSENNNKDVVIKQMSEIVDIVKKIIVDPDLIKSSMHSDLKLKYFNELNAKIESLSKSNPVQISPVYTPEKLGLIVKPTDTTQQVSAVLTNLTIPPRNRPRTTKTQIVSDDIVGRLDIDIHRNPKSIPKLIKHKKTTATDNNVQSSKRINLRLKSNNNGTFYGFDYKDCKYYINFDTNQICDDEFYIVGKIQTGIVTINRTIATDGSDNIMVKDTIHLPILTDLPQSAIYIGNSGTEGYGLLTGSDSDLLPEMSITSQMC